MRKYLRSFHEWAWHHPNTQVRLSWNFFRANSLCIEWECYSMWEFWRISDASSRFFSLGKNWILFIIIFKLNKNGVNDGNGDDDTPRASKAVDLGRIWFAERWLGGVRFRVLPRRLENQLGRSAGVCLRDTLRHKSTHHLSLLSMEKQVHPVRFLSEKGFLHVFFLLWSCVRNG